VISETRHERSPRAQCGCKARTWHMNPGRKPVGSDVSWDLQTSRGFLTCQEGGSQLTVDRPGAPIEGSSNRLMSQSVQTSGERVHGHGVDRDPTVTVSRTRGPAWGSAPIPRRTSLRRIVCMSTSLGPVGGNTRWFGRMWRRPQQGVIPGHAGSHGGGSGSSGTPRRKKKTTVPMFVEGQRWELSFQQRESQFMPRS
jgi:hypothetical protein